LEKLANLPPVLRFIVRGTRPDEVILEANKALAARRAQSTEEY